MSAASRSGVRRATALGVRLPAAPRRATTGSAAGHAACRVRMTPTTTSTPDHTELPATLVVAVGGPAEDPAYLPVHVAAALGTFEAEGVGVTLRRAKHPTGAIDLLRTREAGVAVTTLDQAVRGAWARGVPV